MALWTITHSCGHKIEHQIYGTDAHGERQRRAQWLADQPCDECRKRIEGQMADQDAAARNLPPLEGSDKQVAWAMTIRQKAVASFEAEIARRRQADLRKAERSADEIDCDVAEVKAALHAAICGLTSAKWWIDNRNAGSGPSAYQVMQTVAAKSKEED